MSICLCSMGLFFLSLGKIEHVSLSKIPYRPRQTHQSATFPLRTSIGFMCNVAKIAGLCKMYMALPCGAYCRILIWCRCGCGAYLKPQGEIDLQNITNTRPMYHTMYLCVLFVFELLLSLLKLPLHSIFYFFRQICVLVLLYVVGNISNPRAKFICRIQPIPRQWTILCTCVFCLCLICCCRC